MDSERYKAIWELVMRDLFFATHCHTCGGPMKISENYCGESCSKTCWRYAQDGCRYGGIEQWCLHCLADYNGKHRPSLANPRHVRDCHGLNPMGIGQRFLTKGYYKKFFPDVV